MGGCGTKIDGQTHFSEDADARIYIYETLPLCMQIGALSIILCSRFEICEILDSECVLKTFPRRGFEDWPKLGAIAKDFDGRECSVVLYRSIALHGLVHRISETSSSKVNLIFFHHNGFSVR